MSASGTRRRLTRRATSRTFGAESRQLRRLAGYRGALVLCRRVEEEVELEVLTFWTSMASIRRFAGDNSDKAVVAEEAKGVLRRFDSRVRHFDVALDALFRR